MAISTYHLDTGINNPVNSECTKKCKEASTNISNIRWTENDAIHKDEKDELVWGDVAPQLTSGLCGTDCFECRQSWYDSTPNDKEFRCKDQREMKFFDKCFDWRKQQGDLCMSGED